MANPAEATSRFALFGEVLLVGATVLLVSVPVVTAVPALAVGVRHLRRFLAGESDSISTAVRDLVPALRDLWPLGLLVPGALGVLAFNVWFAAAAGSPGARAAGAVSATVGVAGVVVALRTAGRWIPGENWWLAVRAAAHRARRDLVGSALLVAAVAMCAVLVWMLAPLILLIGGLLVLAMLAVENRLDRAHLPSSTVT